MAKKKVIEQVQDVNEVEMPIQTKHLAAKFGIKATALRRVLRTMPEYADNVHTLYRWSENDPRIDDIEVKLAEIEQEKATKKAAALDALHARAAKMELQAKVDASMLKA